MRASVFCGASVDGFIARPDDRLDFLDAGGGGTDDHGFAAFLASVDALLMGRRTFDVVAGFDGWPYGEKPVFVLTHRPDSVRAPAGARVEPVQGSPAEVWSALRGRGLTHLYVDGGETIQAFLRAGLIGSLIISRVPVLIGQGRPLFGPLDGDVRLTHVRTSTSPGGMVQTEYAVSSAAARPETGV